MDKNIDDDAHTIINRFTPEFMQLYEYQGYCPHTVVHRDALLLRNPALGVIRYRGGYYVFTTEAGLNAFEEDPGRCINGIIDAAGGPQVNSLGVCRIISMCKFDSANFKNAQVIACTLALRCSTSMVDKANGTPCICGTSH